MPEIPDLEVFRKNLDRILHGKVLRGIKGKVLNSASNKITKSILTGQKLSGIHREGKQLFFKFSKGNVIAVHLMLHGEFHIPKKTEKLKQSMLEFKFDEVRLVVTDWQKQANATLDPEPSEVPDVLSPQCNTRYLRKIMESHKAIKSLLRDQSKLRGLGNAYTDEILWETRISPFSICNAIPGSLIPRLNRNIRKVLKSAIKQILKEDPERITGELRDFLKIHNARKKMSPTGYPILREKKGSSSTYYTKEQKLYR